MDIVFATKNQGKLKEIKALFEGTGLTVISMEEAGILSDVAEDGDTFEANAKIKAVEIMRQCGKLTLADDSGLEVEALDGQPGVLSARYMGKDTEYTVKNRHIIELLEKADNRGARFVCAIAAAFPPEISEGEVITTLGVLSGVIAKEPAGNGGFGYDPIFYMPEHGMTLAEMSAEQKNKISHRAMALAEMKQILGQKLNFGGR